MAIYRLEKKSISRGNGHNLCAAVAYRAGLKIADDNPKNDDRKTHDYSKKSDVAHREIILTDELKNAGLELDFEQIANLVETGETTKRGKMKKSAKLASEYVLAGSHELSLDENIQAFREFAEQQSKEQGVIAMVFVHDPKLGNDLTAGADAGDPTRHHDPRNIHAHVVLLSRQVDLTANGRLELGKKSVSELSDTDRKKKGLPSSREWLKGVREQWAEIQNKSLERHNIAPISHLSYRELGLDIKPSKHLGKDATALESKGISTHIGAYNREVEQHNDIIIKQSADSVTIDAEQAINRASRTLERTARPSPSPYEQNSRAGTATDADTALNDFNEQAIIFNQLTEQANSNARHREPTINSAYITVRQLAERDAMMFANRNHDNRYTEQQKQYLQAFAEKNRLDTGDLRANISQSVAFFSDLDNAIAHKDVISLLRKPENHEIKAPQAHSEPNTSQDTQTAQPNEQNRPSQPNKFKP